MTTRRLDEHGRVLCGRYALQRLLGRGGMSEVHLARDLELGRHVAVKLLAGGAAEDGVERLRDEAKAAAALDHPGIVTVHDIGTADGTVFIVMAYLEGESLAERLGRDGALPVAEVVRIGVAVCSALDAAHRAGVVHRDVSPGNIMLCRDGSVTVTDFGIARMSASVSRTATGQVIGTPAYLSPEQARGETVDGRSDLYSLGCCLYAALTGRPPFDGPDPLSVVLHHLHDAPAPPRSWRPEIPVSLEALVLGAMSKDPRHRPSTAGEMRAALDASIIDAPIIDAPTHDTPAPDTPAPDTPALDTRTLPASSVVQSGSDAALDATLAETDPDHSDQADRRHSLGIALMIVALGLLVLVAAAVLWL